MLKLHDIDLNLLRLFDAVYRARSVSRAAEALGLPHRTMYAFADTYSAWPEDA